MTTTIEHQAALARIDEMKRYAEQSRRHRRTAMRPSRRRPQAVLVMAARRLRLA
jgi:hypothetical protein